MREQLNDTNTYICVDKDPTKKLISELHALISDWKKLDYISEGTYKSLNRTYGVLPRAYGLPKIHKSNCPLRIIVSSLQSPLYPLARFLHHIIHQAVPKSNGFIENSFHREQLVKKSSGLCLDEHYKLVSLDVVSLFTNVPVDMAIESIKKRWIHIGKKCEIPRDSFIRAVKFVLNSTFFVFEGAYYQQTFGTPMGSPLSPIIADITLQDLESWAVATLPFYLPFYIRYVDDIALAAPSSMLDKLKNTFNSYHPRLQFTLEVGVDNKLNFLDVTIINNNGHVEFDWYHKPTFSGRFLNFESQHPLCHKKGTVISLIDRVFWLSHPRFHQKNLEFTFNVLMDNGFPLEFIFKVTAERIKKFTLKTKLILFK